MSHFIPILSLFLINWSPKFQNNLLLIQANNYVYLFQM